MPIELKELEDIIRNGIPDSVVEVKDLAGDKDHLEVKIVSKAFAGKSRIDQHKMVQNLVKDKNIHALSIKTALS